MHIGTAAALMFALFIIGVTAEKALDVYAQVHSTECSTPST